MHDIFISYEHESKSIADNIVASLESSKIRCWYAPRDVIDGGKGYADSICDAIRNAKIFLLILSGKASNSPFVSNEVEIAYKQIIENKIIILPFKVDNEILSQSMEFYVKRLHWIDACNRSLDAAIEDLKNKIYSLIGITPPLKKNIDFGQRIENKYFSLESEFEQNRLDMQQNLFRKNDYDVYEEIIKNKCDLNILDLGCHNGDLIMNRIGSKNVIKKLIGIECDENTVLSANKKYGNDNNKFYCFDLEEDEIEKNIINVMKENNIEEFDIVHISMLILHLKNPYLLLKRIRKLMKNDGIIFIKDIDDGLNLAYPDTYGSFARAFEICSKSEFSGYRFSGREIFTHLRKLGFKDITLKKDGINAIGMTYEEKQTLFDIYFSFIKEDYYLMMKKYFDDEKIKEEYEWYVNTYYQMEEEFLSDSFFFNLGIMIYTAKK